MLIDVNFSKNTTNYRLLMAGITQNKQKCLTFTVVPRGRKRSN